MDRARMERLVTGIKGRLLRAWSAMLAHLHEQNSVEAIAARLHVADPTVLLRGLDAAAASFAAAEYTAYTGAGELTARWLTTQLTPPGRRRISKKLLHFDPAESVVVQWAEQNRLDLIREITTEQRMLIRDALMGGAMTGANPRVVAREIRDSIGLTVAQERAVQSYRAALESGRYSAALQRELSSGVSDRVIAAARGAGRELTQAQIETAVARYRENFVTLRAETIARTEALRIAHQANEELFRQAVERGDLRADQIERTWHHSAGAKRTKNERVFHRSMEGQKRGYGELFTSGHGSELRFPCDPNASAEETVNCRCVVSTRILGSASSSAGAASQPGLGAAADEEASTGMAADEAAIEEEATAAEEAELDAELADFEADAAGEEAAAGFDDAAAGADEAALAGELEPDLGFDAEGSALLEPPFGSRGGRPQQHQQQMQRAQARLADREAAHAETRADLEAAQAAHEQATVELEAAQREVDGLRIGVDSEGDGFRIGVNSEIAGETEQDTVDWLHEQQARLEQGRRAADAATAAETAEAERAGAMRIGVNSEIAGDPLPEPPPRDTVVPSDKPAPVGFEPIEYNDELYYRQRVNGRSYTREQLAERAKDSYAIELTGPNEVIPGFETLEVKTRGMSSGEIRYRSETSGASYTPEMVASGEAKLQEEFLAHPERGKKRPGLLGRLFGLDTWRGRGG